MTFRRIVAPFDDVEVDVDVEDVLEDFHGVPPKGLAQINAWIASGAVQVDVASPQHYLPPRLLETLRFPAFTEDFGAGKGEHRRLCAIAVFFLMVTRGRGVTYGSTGSGCAYAGGWGDARMLDGSLFVECGTLGSTKLYSALRAQQTLMILPYRWGCRMPRAAFDRLVLEPNMGDVEHLTAEDRARILSMRREDSIQLAYTFTPIDVPTVSIEELFEKNAAKGMFK